MPLISLITATHNKRWIYYADAAKSVLSQKLPSGWKFEWLIQIDGVDKEVHETLEHLSNKDERIILDQNHAQLGPGGTRNLALARAKGDLCRVMDSDDIMLPDSLAKQINIFQEHSDIHWSTYQPIELSADGKQTPDPARIPTGAAEPGALNRAMARLGRCPVHCAGLMIRTDTLRAFGGWAGLPVGEDVTLLAAASELYHGWVMEGYGWLYRRHKSQITNSLKDPSWRTMGEDIGQQRIRAIKKLGWQV